MPKIEYIPRNFSEGSLDIIGKAETILEDYAEQGFTVTLRQLYYQFVKNLWLENKQSEYKRLGSILSDARLAGLIDWEHMEDRVRNVDELPNWGEPQDFLSDAPDWYRRDRWDNQEVRPFVMIEKDALAGVIQPTCYQYRVPYLACRGNVSQSELWRLGQRFEQWTSTGQRVVVFHLGDHDPNGMDMTRDNQDRILRFCGEVAVPVERIALNMDQVRRFKLPPNPAKEADSRFGRYVEQYGNKSWELDALSPKFIAELLESHFKKFIDQELWQENREREREEKIKITKLLGGVAKNWTRK